MYSRDYYELLGVSAGASPDDIRAAYHQAVRRFHPDVNRAPGAAEEFRRLAEAYHLLDDPEQRAAYDAARPPGAEPRLHIETLYSRQALPALNEPQVLYALYNLRPGVERALPSPAVNLCIVVDRSTSMQGPRLDHVKGAVLRLIDSLRAEDTFAVVSFSDRADVVVPAQSGQADRMVAKARVTTLSAQGGTEMLQGLLCGLVELHRHLKPSVVNHLLLITDGRTYGDEDDCLLLARLAATDGIQVSSLGVGEEWNDDFLDALAGRTGGSVAYIHAIESLPRFLQERVRGFSQVYGDRVTLTVTPDPGVELAAAFRVTPDAGPLPLERPLRLGSLLRERALGLLLKFRLPPLEAGRQSLARLRFAADVVGLGQEDECALVDLSLPVVRDAPALAPSPVMLDALSLVLLYQLQERAWRQLAAGDAPGAAERLRTLGTRLMAAGQAELARAAAGAAAAIETTRAMPEELKKQLKYGTRALIASPRRGARR